MDDKFPPRIYISKYEIMAMVKSITYTDESYVEVDLTMDEMDKIAEIEDRFIPWAYGLNEVEFMNCTGLTAAKSYRGESEFDRLAFEGDIVRIRGMLYKVEWQYAKWAFECIGKEIYDRLFFYPHIRNSEIIGNIHQHKHLLERGGHDE